MGIKKDPQAETDPLRVFFELFSNMPYSSTENLKFSTSNWSVNRIGKADGKPIFPSSTDSRTGLMAKPHRQVDAHATASDALERDLISH